MSTKTVNKVKDNTTVNTTAPEVKDNTTAPESKILSELKRDLAPLNEVGKAKLLIDFEEHTINKIENIDIKMERAAALHAIIDGNEPLLYEIKCERESRAYIAKFNKFFDSLSTVKNEVMISVLVTYVKTPKYWRDAFLEVMDTKFPVNFTNSSSTAQQGGICGDTLYTLSLQGLLPVDNFTENDIQYIIDSYFKPRVEKRAAARKSGIVVC